MTDWPDDWYTFVFCPPNQNCQQCKHHNGFGCVNPDAPEHFIREAEEKKKESELSKNKGDVSR